MQNSDHSSAQRSFSFLFWLPTAVTLLGLFLSLWWIATGNRAAGVCGLLCDAADGQLARRLGVVSDFGGDLDWMTDCTMAALIVYKASLYHDALLWALLLLLPLQVLLRLRKVRVSGRCLLMLGAMGVGL